MQGISDTNLEVNLEVKGAYTHAKKQWSPEQKLQIVLEALKEERHMGEIASEHVNERKAMVDWDISNSHLTIKAQAGLLSLNRTGLYWTAKGVSKHEVEIKHLIDKVRTQHPFKGSRRIVQDINNMDGVDYKVNRKRIQRYMREWEYG